MLCIRRSLRSFISPRTCGVLSMTRTKPVSVSWSLLQYGDPLSQEEYQCSLDDYSIDLVPFTWVPCSFPIFLFSTFSGYSRSSCVGGSASPSARGSSLARCRCGGGAPAGSGAAPSLLRDGRLFVSRTLPFERRPLGHSHVRRELFFFIFSVVHFILFSIYSITAKLSEGK